MNKLNWIVIFIFMLISTGCATSSKFPIGEDFSSDNVSQIEKGKTTKDDIVKMFGKPFAKTVSVVSKNEEIWMYVYIDETENVQSDIVTTEVANEDQVVLKNGVVSESDVVTTEGESEVVSTSVANENNNTFDILLKNGIISESGVVKTQFDDENQKALDAFLEDAIVSTTDVETVEVKSRENKKTLDVLMKSGVVSDFTFTEGPEPYIEDPSEGELSLMKRNINTPRKFTAR